LNSVIGANEIQINQQNVKGFSMLLLSTPVWNDVWFTLKYFEYSQRLTITV
jgi:hypothetical protein